MAEVRRPILPIRTASAPGAPFPDRVRGDPGKDPFYVRAASQTPFTLPVSYSKDNRFYYGYFNYSGINNMKLPLYHRLDVGIEKRGKTKKGNTKILSVNIYNIYAHQNPVYVYYNP